MVQYDSQLIWCRNWGYTVLQCTVIVSYRRSRWLYNSCWFYYVIIELTVKQRIFLAIFKKIRCKQFWRLTKFSDMYCREFPLVTEALWLMPLIGHKNIGTWWVCCRFDWDPRVQFSVHEWALSRYWNFVVQKLLVVVSAVHFVDGRR